MEPVVDVAPFVGVITTILTWSFFIIVLAMLKNFIANGFSIAIAEFLLKNCNEETQIKLVRWLSNGDLVLKELQKHENKS